MSRITLTAALGLMMVTTAPMALADTIIVERPTTLPETSVRPNPYANPSFQRMAEICAQMGVECGAPASDGPYGTSPEALADAEKRMELYADELAAFAEDYAEALGIFIDEDRPVAPRALPRGPAVVPQELFDLVLPRAFGWPRTHILPRPHAYTPPHAYPRPNIEIYQFGHRIPAVPRIQAPRLPFSGHGLIPWPAL